MRQTLISVASLLTGMSFLMLGAGALSTILGLRAAQADWASTTVGLITGMYFLGIVMGTGFCHRLISNVGHIRTFTALGSIFSAATLLHAFYVDPVVWGILRFIGGVCATGMFMCTESWLNERADNTNRGQVFAFYQIAVFLAQGAGQFLINLPDGTGFVIYVTASVLLSVAVVPVALTRVAAPPPPPFVRYRMRDLYTISPTGMVVAFAAGLLLGAFYGIGPLFAQRIGLDVAGTANFMGITIIGGLLLQWPLGRLSDRFDRRIIILVISVAVAAVSLAFATAAHLPVAAVFGLAVLFGGTAFVLYPLAVSYTNDYLDPVDLVPASAGLLVAYGLGAALGPIGASAAVAASDAAGLFLFCAGVGGATASFILWRMSQRAAIEDQADFQAIPSTTAMAYEMDPRADWEEEEPGDQVETDAEGAPIPAAYGPTQSEPPVLDSGSDESKP